MDLAAFGISEVWLQDFEYSTSPGERPSPVCFVANEFFSGRTIKLFGDELQHLKHPPHSIASDSMTVAYYAPAELSCYLSLGWPLPEHVLDLFTEFRNATNGLDLPAGASLIGALVYFGLDAMGATEKESMQQLALRGKPYTAGEQELLLNYCESDVLALRKLLKRTWSSIDALRAIYRGRYMKAVARIEHAGIPIDTAALAVLNRNWSNIQDELIRAIDVDFGVYENRTFKIERFEHYLSRNQFSWPHLPSGRPALDAENFKVMAGIYPQIEPLRQLRESLSKMRLNDLAVGNDGRNRCMLSPFRACTSRNQPSNSQFIFGQPTWQRPLIRPTEGNGIAYIDWCQQEFGIAAELSGDRAMQEAYRSGDPYDRFAEQAGAVPATASRTTRAEIRNRFKACALAVQYGMGDRFTRSTHRTTNFPGA